MIDMPINEPLDISTDFFDWKNEVYIPVVLNNFNADTGSGNLQWQYHQWVIDRAFNTGGMHLERMEKKKEFWREQNVHPTLSFSVSFIGDRTIRLRMNTKRYERKDISLMLVKEPQTTNWSFRKEGNEHIYSGKEGSIKIYQQPWKLELFDKNGALITSTLALDLLDQPHPK